MIADGSSHQPASEGTPSRRLTDPGAESAAERVVEALRRRGGTASTTEIGQDLGIHSSTARFHLDHLVTAGRVQAGRENRASRGRPRTLFTLVSEPTEGPRSYQLLAEVLVSHLSHQHDPARAAAEAGRQWGRRFAGTDVVRLLERIGFAPGSDPDRPGRTALGHCPFIDLAVEHPEVVCPLHRGVVEAAVGHPVTLEAHPGDTCFLAL